MPTYANDELNYEVIIQLVVGGDLSQLRFQVTEKDYRSIRQQIKNRETFLIFSLWEKDEPVSVNVGSPNVITVNTTTHEKPKLIVAPDVSNKLLTIKN